MAFEPITTQEEFDKVIKERIERAENKVRSQFGDYEELKKKAQAYDEDEEAKKTELQKANDRIAELEDEAKKRTEADTQRELRAKVAKETGVPEELITGTDEESMKAYADKLAEFAKVQIPPAPKDPTPGAFSDDPKGDSEQRTFVKALFGNDEN